jgi:hypothetical protein
MKNRGNGSAVMSQLSRSIKTCEDEAKSTFARGDLVVSQVGNFWMALNLCSLCAEKHEATRQCLDCGVLMCLDISRVHSMFKENKDHRVATIQEAQEHLRAHPLPVVLMCPEHPDKAFEYFDESCQKLLCVSCAILGNHSGHKCKSISEAARVGRGEFQQAIENLTSKIAELQTQGNSTQGILQDFTAIAQSRRTEVDSVRHFD